MRLLICAFFTLSLAAAPPKAEACVECHDTVNLETFHTRSHGGVACVQCHTAIKALPHDEKLPPVQCVRCHSHQVKDFAMSVHGIAKAKGKEHAPTCGSCHGKTHDIVGRGNAGSQVARKNMAATCGKCHAPDFLAKLETRLPHRTSRMALSPEEVK